MKNQLVHLMLNDEVRIIAADTTQLVEEAKAIHGTYPVATAVLGRTLTAAAGMGEPDHYAKRRRPSRNGFGYSQWKLRS